MVQSQQRTLHLVLMGLAALTTDAAATTSIGRPHTCGGLYPPALQQQGVQGTTTLAFYVTRHGSVREISVAESSGNADLDAAAVYCAQHWRYKPATQGGRPVEAEWKAKVVWALPPPAADAPPSGPAETPKTQP